MGNTNLKELAQEAFVYGFPLNSCIEKIVEKGEKAGGWNIFEHTSQLAGPDDEFVSVNNDSFYSHFAGDLSVGPLIVSVPEIKDRYYVLQFIDTWTNNFAYVGSRSTQGEAGEYFITPQDWSGEVPQGMTQIKSPTRVFVCCGRISCFGPSDIEAASKVQHSIKVQQLNENAKATGLPTIDENTPEELEWFETFKTYMNEFKPSDEDTKYQEKFAPLGLLENDKALHESLDDDTKAVLKEIDRKRDEIAKNFKPTCEIRVDSHWIISPHAFDYNNSFFEFGTYSSPEWIIADRSKAFEERAFAAHAGLWGNNGYEATYPMTYNDADGNKLDGRNGNVYTLTFKDPLPVDAFWSLTMYDVNNFYLVDNKINRYSIGDRTQGLKYNEDGSLTITVSHEEPKDETAKANWLPAPNAEFRPLIRLYLPKKVFLEGEYKLPGFILNNQ